MQNDYSNLPYPVRYGVVPIYRDSREGGFPLSYIVSKVFIIIESDVYTDKGYHKEYFVVSPVKNLNAFYVTAGLRIPMFASDGHCINQESCKYVFDDYEDARKIRDVLNGSLYIKQYPFDSFEKRTEFFQRFEKDVMVKTTECKMGFNNKIKKL